MASWPTYPLRTARLLLRPITLADVDGLLSYRGRADACRYLPFEPMTRQAVVDRINRDLGRTELTDEDQAVTLGIELPETGRLIGDVVLFYRSRPHHGGEIGYVTHPDVRGHGYATEATAAMLDLAFDVVGMHRVIARIDARNDDSVRLARRLGMRQEAYLVENEWFKGEWSDEIVLAVLDREWQANPLARGASDRTVPPSG